MNGRPCSACKEVVSLPYMNYCSACRKKMRKERYQLAESRALTARRKKFHSELLKKLKNCPCTDCGKILEQKKMEFDHVPGRGEKLFDISKGMKYGCKKLLAEIAKCDLVCCFCHRKRTSRRLKEKKVLPTPLVL